MSFYLKYRPQKVSELDLEKVRLGLEQVLRSGDVPHAYLFTGPKGTGKTSSARIIAKVLNCETNKEQVARIKSGEGNGKDQPLNEPCGKCGQCVAIQKGSSLSVLEMNAASNRGIDDIRQLRERIGMAPAEGMMTVYVIDEVHMLTTEAFNALLKTLEEPPGHAVFVLCTTEAHKVPDTIMSRCTRIMFYKASKAEVVRSLEKVVKGEKLQIDKGVLEAIAERVDGSFRDGMKILEQLAQVEGKISLEQVDELTGYSDEYDPSTFLDRLMEKDAPGALQELHKREQMGVDFSVFGKRLVEILRERLLQSVMKTSDAGAVNELNNLIMLFSPAVNEIKLAVAAALPLEVASVEWCVGVRQNSKGRSHDGEVEDKAGGIKKEKAKNEPPKYASSTPNTQSNIGVSNTKVRKELKKPNREAIPEKVSKKKGSIATGKMPDIEEVIRVWPQLLSAVKPHNNSLEALLRAAEPEECTNDWVQLRVYYTFHKEQLEQERHRRILEEVFSQELGMPVKLQFTLGEKTNKAVKTQKELVNVTGDVGDEALAKAAEEIFSN